jgi:DnaJ family protein C protein 7
MKAEKSAGNAAFRAGRYERAYEKYTASINVDSNADEYNSVLYCNRAAASMAMGHFDKAIHDCDKALSLCKDYEKARLRRGRAYVACGKYVKAIEDLEWVLLVSPGIHIHW